MSKLLSVWLPVLCLTIVLATAASAQNHAITLAEQTRLNEELLGDAQFGSVKTVLADLKRGADVNYFHSDANALMAAIASRSQDIALALLDHGARVDARDKAGETVLIIATKERYDTTKLVQALLKHGAAVNVHDRLNITPLQAALMSRKPAIAAILKAHGARIGFFEAVLDGDVALVRTLLAHRETAIIADLGKALRYAAIIGNTNMIGFLLSHGVKVDAHDSGGETPLMCATEHGNADAVKQLLDRGANMRAVDHSGSGVLARVPSGFSRAANKPTVLSVLLDHGLPVESRDHFGTTLLVESVQGFDPNTVALLLKRGANPNQKDDDGDTPLMAASYWTQYDFVWGQEGYSGDNVKLLLKAGAKPDAQNKLGMTALMYAAGWHHPAVVTALLDGGAATDLKDKLGRTALTWAARDGTDSFIVKKLLAKGARPTIADALLMGDQEHASAMLARGDDATGRGPYGETALMIAVELKPDFGLIKSLVDRGLDVNATDEEGVTSLMLAIDPETRSRQSRMFPKKAPPINMNLVRLLLNHGADVNARAKGKQTVQTVAAASGNEELIDLLKTAK